MKKEIIKLLLAFYDVYASLTPFQITFFAYNLNKHFYKNFKK